MKIMIPLFYSHVASSTFNTQQLMFPFSRTCYLFHDHLFSGNMDPFASFFGGFGFDFDDGHPPGRGETPRGADVVIDLWVTLEELYSGNFVEVRSGRSL